MIQSNFSEMQSAITDNDPDRLKMYFQRCAEALKNSSDQSAKIFYSKICNNLMLEGLFKLSKLDESMRWFQMNFLERDCRPNLMTFEILIDGLLNHWKESDAQKIQNLMINEYFIKPGIGVYNLWISYHLKNHQLDKAKDLI